MVAHRLILTEKIRALGWPGLIGGILLLVCLSFALALVLPAEQQRQEVSLRAVQAAAILARAERGEAIAPQTQEGQREAFYRDFPGPGDITHRIEAIYAAAADNQLSLARGEYLQTPVKETRLVRYQITLPVRGSYPQIRSFIAAAQAAVPKLGLDELSLQRQEISDTQVEARIRFSLYVVYP